MSLSSRSLSPTEGKEICLALVARDRGGNAAIDEAADAGE